MPQYALVQVRQTADDVVVAWDGAVKYDNKAAEVLTIDNSAATDWDTDDTVYVVIFGAPVDLASIESN